MMPVNGMAVINSAVAMVSERKPSQLWKPSSSVR
jgi:hypothetical protein